MGDGGVESGLGVGEVEEGTGLTAQPRMSAMQAKALRIGGPKDRGDRMGEELDSGLRR